MASGSLTPISPDGIVLEDHALSVPCAMIETLSPDGRYCVSSYGGILTIFDLQTGESWRYVPEGDNDYFSVGSGPAFSSTGVLVGSVSLNGTASYWEKGKWRQLLAPCPDRASVANGINSDGSIICGVAQPADDNGYAGYVRAVPVIWRRNAVGGYNQPEKLPYPVNDFTGRVPNYVSALCVSDDGNTVLGQVYDYSGLGIAPIVYTCDNNGTWSYDYLGEELCNPEQVAYPEWPEDIGAPPSPEDYMSDEERDKYLREIWEWEQDDRYTDTEPDYSAHMTASQLADFEESAASYSALATRYNEKVSEWMRFFARQMADDDVRVFTFNNLFMNSDASQFVSTRRVFVRNSKNAYDTKIEMQPCLFVRDAEGKYTVTDMEPGYCASQMADNGSMLAYSLNDGLTRAYIASAVTGRFVAFENYIRDLNEPLGTWLIENWTHEMPGLYAQDGKRVISGKPTCTPDMSLLSTSTYNYWDAGPGCPFGYSYLFGTNMNASANSISIEPKPSVNAIGNGLLQVEGWSNISIYAIDGKLLYTADGVSEKIDTGLGSGIYIVHVNTPAGIPYAFRLKW